MLLNPLTGKPLDPARPPLELLRLRLRLGGLEAKRPIFPRLWKDSFRGRWPCVEDPPPMLALAASVLVLGGVAESRPAEGV